MRHRTILKTALPPVFGVLASWSFSQLWGFIYPPDPSLEHEIELSTPGIVFALEYLLNFLGPILLLIFQYFVIVPATIASTKKAFLVTLSVGFGLSFVICLQMLRPGVAISLKDFVLAFTSFFMGFESYFLINLTTIMLLNNFKPKLEATVHLIKKITFIIIPGLFFFLVMAYIVNQTSLICDHGCFNNGRITSSNTLFEELLESCNNSPKTITLDTFDFEKESNYLTRFTANLYEGNGGATTDFSYSITVKFPGERETEIFSSYGHPYITSLECSDDSLSFKSDKKETFNIKQLKEMSEGRKLIRKTKRL